MRAKKEGTGTVTVNDASKILDAHDAYQQKGSQMLSFTILPATPTASQQITSHETTQQAQEPVYEATSSWIVTAATSSTSTSTVGSNALAFIAAVAGAITLDNIAFWVIGLIIVAIAIAYLIYRSIRNRE